MRFDQQFIKNHISDAQWMGPELPENWDASIDSRELKKGDIFFALRGALVDGHDFLEEVLAKGASGLVINAAQKKCLATLDAAKLKKVSVVLVPDTRKALIELATAWRKQFSCPVIGITGSVGKTSTKEMLCNIFTLAGKKFISSVGNQNTEIGASLSILRMRAEHEIAVFEMGISKRGEMARLAALVQPTTAIITAIGHSHMEGLGSLMDIAHEKRDIFKYFKQDNVGIIHGDQPILAQISYNHPMVKFGLKTTNQVQARKIQANNENTQFVLKLYKDRYLVTLDTNHAGRVLNALAAASAAYLAGVSGDIIVKGIQMPLSISGRFTPARLKASKGLIINDCYNASPESMKAALLAFEKVDSLGQKIAVLGDMLELGVNSSFWHRQLGRFLRKVPSLHHVVLVGNHVKFTKATVPVGMSFEHVSNWQEAVDVLQKRLDKEAVILVKASSGMHLEHLIEKLT